MKKLVAFLTLFLAFAFSASAQEKKLAPEVAAKNDAVEITQYLGLTESQQTSFIALFKKKHELMQNPTVSAERKQEMTRIVGMKINATIDGNQQDKLAANPELWKRLTE